MMKFKKLFLIIFVFLFSITIVGCNSKEQDEVPEIDNPGEIEKPDINIPEENENEDEDIKPTRVEEIMANMTLKQKVTQMMMVDFRYWDENPNDNIDKVAFTKMNSQIQKIVEDYDFGAIIYFAQNIQETEQSLKLSLALQEAAIKDNGIPLIISADQEGGMVYRLGTGTALPGNMALGATNDVANAKIAGEIIGSELKAVGINTTLAPVVDVNNNANNPVIGLRSYSDDPTLVGNMASKTIEGLKEYNVIGCAKHFPGHGDTATDSHYGLPIVNKSKDALLHNELLPFNVAIENDIEMIMTAHILYPQLDNTTVKSNKTGKMEKLPATLSKKIITDLLKGEMNFNGVVTTDAMNMQGISAIYNQDEAVILAINAGVDMICMPTNLSSRNDLRNLDRIINSVLNEVNNGKIKQERIDDAVKRILTLKEKRGILDYNKNDYSVANANSIVGSKTNREKERVIASKAVTVIKNKNNLLPLRITGNTNLLMLCPYDNEKSQMIMGWNRAKEAGLIPNGSNVDVLRFKSDTLISQTEVKQKLEKANIIIINSEISRTNRLIYKDDWRSGKVNMFVEYASSHNKKSIVMSVDKPYDVQLYDKADAIVAVYGCKGSTVDVTEALTGSVTSSKSAYGPNIIAGIEVILGVYGASGKLPVNIPLLDKTKVSFTDTILYKRGYGLTYDSLLNK